MVAKKQFYTYLHCKPDGTPFYVGKGTGRRSHSFSSHAGRSSYHTRIVEKYGKDNIRVFVFPCESEEQAFADEVHQIAQFRREGFHLVNSTNGGEGASGFKHSEQARAKISVAQVGKSKRPEHRHKISEMLKGRKLTAEHCAKMSASRTGEKKPPRSPEHCAAISTAQKGSAANTVRMKELGLSRKGKPLSTEHRAKMSAAHMGNKMPPRSPEHCAKISAMRKAEWALKRHTEATLRVQGESK